MAGRVSRGEIWMYRFARPDKRRPVLVLSRQRALDHLKTAVIAPVTTTGHGLPSEVAVGVDEGLKQASFVNFDHLYTVPQVELKAFVGSLDPEKMNAVCAALAIALGCA
jgi:mRNA interferase MazF